MPSTCCVVTPPEDGSWGPQTRQARYGEQSGAETCASYDLRSCGVIRPGRTLLLRTFSAIAAASSPVCIGSAPPAASARSVAAYSEFFNLNPTGCGSPLAS